MSIARTLAKARSAEPLEDTEVTVANSPSMSAFIADSWARCRAFGYTPEQPSAAPSIEPADLERRLLQNQHLLTAAAPIIDELQGLVEDLGFVTLLTDTDGVILKMLSRHELRTVDAAGNLCVGGVWSEEQAGTSAIGLALILERPIQVVGEQHYFERDYDLTCSAAPIFSPDNHLVGILNVSGPSKAAHLHTLGIVVVASKAIASQLSIEENNRKLWLANEYLTTVINSISDGILAIDSRGTIMEINSEACNLLGEDVSTARGKNIQDLTSRHPLFKQICSDGKPVTDIETTLETRRGYIHCHVSARPIALSSGRVVGAVATLKEMKHVHRVVTQIIGAEARFSFTNIIGPSSTMQRAIHLAQVAARNMHTVLIQGESGTGKELFAQAIHNASIPGQPFVALNCAAIPETLIESELFGYEGGSFTGASKNGRPGKFELANDGTIFLDEIGEMPLNIQTVLLRVLQERSVVRIGGHRSTPVNVRVIAATSKQLADEVLKGNFRQDLFYRLNVFEIRIPPLRERVTDIPVLVECFVARFSARFGKFVVGISPTAMKRLRGYLWPGNVRQLENVIERAISLVEGDTIEEQHLPDFLFSDLHAPADKRSFGSGISNIESVEKKAILEAVFRFRERQQAAKSLGISRSTLYRRLKRYSTENSA